MRSLEKLTILWDVPLMQLKLKPEPRAVARILTALATTIAIISLMSDYLVEIVFAQEDTLLLDFLDLFSVNLEDSIPTWYSVLILFVASVLLFVIAYGKSQSKDDYTLHWWGLAGIFLYFSMDEGAVIHEIFAIPLQEAFNTDGFLAFGWQIIAFPLVIIFGLLYLKFLFHLPPKTRNYFILSAILYAGGALIIEGFSASQYDDTAITMSYLILATIEEFFEIFGVSLFIFALLDYLQQIDYSLQISAKEGNLQSEALPSDEDNLGQSTQTISWNPMLLLIVFLIIMNIASFAWILGNRPNPVDLAVPTFYESVQTELEQDNVIILEAPDTFGIENRHSLAIVRSLSATYEEIYVIAFPSDSRSVIFSGNNLSFDRDTLTEWLHANGQIEFIIFDPASITVMLEN